MNDNKNDNKGLDPAPDANRDPITGEPGAHPVGVAGGGTGGALAGAAIGGAVGGPVGAAVGGAIGAVAGGLAGKGAAEVVNPTEEEGYWRNEHRNRPYYSADKDFDTHYAPAYRYGWETASEPTYGNRPFDEVEPELERNWSTRGNTSSNWNDVRPATRDAFERVRTRRTTDGSTGNTGALGSDQLK